MPPGSMPPCASASRRARRSANTSPCNSSTCDTAAAEKHKFSKEEKETRNLHEGHEDLDAALEVGLVGLHELGWCNSWPRIHCYQPGLLQSTCGRSPGSAEITWQMSAVGTTWRVTACMLQLSECVDRAGELPSRVVVLSQAHESVRCVSAPAVSQPGVCVGSAAPW